MEQTSLDEIPIKVQQKGIKNEQMEEIISLQDELKISKLVLRFIERKYNVTRIEDLSEVQAEVVIRSIHRFKVKKQ